MKSISKAVFLSARICMTRGWFDRAGAVASAPSEGDLFRMEQGQAVGRLARDLYPQGLLIEPGDTADAARRTRDAMADPKVSVLFEAAFQADNYVARADIIKRSADGWDVLEVKMNLDGTPKISELTDDLAYTVGVVRKCGIVVTSASLILLSRQLRKGTAAAGAFVVINKTAEVAQRLNDFAPLWGEIAMGTSSPKPPVGKLIPDCRGCEYFCTHCLGMGVNDPVFHLPGLRANRIAQLRTVGVVSIDSLPPGFQLTDMQQRAVNCVKTRKPFVGPTFRNELRQVKWPAHYLDFESVMTALPLYDAVAPFEQIVTQFSIHHCSAPGVVTHHSEYLADSSRDCQRELAERLLRDLGDKGSIIVYSSFESVRIDALAARFPDQAPALVRLKARLFDLLPVIRRGFYCHELKGSFSIKALLPAMIPEMSYEGLGIADGDTAVARYAKMAMARYSNEAAAKVKAELKEYCRLDTLAMLRLHQALLQLA